MIILKQILPTKIILLKMINRYDRKRSEAKPRATSI